MLQSQVHAIDPIAITSLKIQTAAKHMKT